MRGVLDDRVGDMVGDVVLGDVIGGDVVAGDRCCTLSSGGRRILGDRRSCMGG